MAACFQRGCLRGAWLVLAWIACACGSTPPPEAGNGETHFLFLEHCRTDAECGSQLSCLCGACTRRCKGDESCGTLSLTASCDEAASAAASCGAQPIGRVCAQRCQDDEDCSQLAANDCDDGYCRARPAADAPDAGRSGGSGGAGGTRATGGNGGVAAIDAGSAGSSPPVTSPDAGGPAAADDCELPADPGTCEALIPRFHHDPLTHSCRRFDYGGCDGNANNFETLQACQQACGVPPDSPCTFAAGDPSLPGVTVSVTADRCHIPTGQGQLFSYQVMLAEPITFTAPDSGGGCGRCRGFDDPVRLVDVRVGDGTRHYCECDGGCCSPTVARSVTLQAGTFSGSLDWPGVEWDGASDTQEPFGPAFPSGAYEVTIDFDVPGVGAVTASLPITLFDP